MRIALTGVSGFIGSALARRLTADGHEVIGLVRDSSRTDHIRSVVRTFVTGSHADASARADLLRDADAVIHNSFAWEPLRSADLHTHLQDNLLASIAFLEEAGDRPFIFISSIAVHHDMRPRWQGLIDEDHPLRPAGLYGATKAAIEAHLWAAHYTRGQFTVALRPCGVYGVDPRLERSHGYQVIEKMKRGERVFSKPGGGKFIHVDDVAEAAARCLNNPAAAGRPFNLVDCYARWADWALMAAEALGIADQVQIDLSSPTQPQNSFDTTALKEALGFAPNRGHAGIRAVLDELIDRMARP